MSTLHDLLDRFRSAAATHREQGTYFEELTVAYLKNEPVYRELYRSVEPYAVWAERQGLDKRDAQYRVEKMAFGKGKDKTVIHYNELITVRDIPLEAYEYVVNGKPAIEWVRERQCVFTEEPSGIVKDANAWATETVGDPRYPLSLLLRVITVSLETMKIVRGLPPLTEAEGYQKAEEKEYLMVAEPVARRT